MDSATAIGCSVDGPHLHVVRRDNPNRASAKCRDRRIVPVGPWVLAYYDRYLDERGACRPAEGCDFVFVNLFHDPKGAAMTDSAVRQLFHRLSRQAGLARPVTPHLLRHSTASELVDAGVAIDVVQAILGHRSIVCTQIYAHPSERRMRDAVDLVDRNLKERRALKARRESR